MATNKHGWNSWQDIATMTGRNWTKNNKFWIEFRNASRSPYWNFLTQDTDRHFICASVIDVNLYDIVADPMEAYINEQYVQTHGRIQSSQIAVKFRDFDQGYLYSQFHKAFYELNRDYIDKTALTITMCLDSGWGGEKHLKFCEARNCVMVSISGLTFDYGSKNQFLEFSVTFKTPRLEYDPPKWGTGQPARKKARLNPATHDNKVDLGGGDD